METNGFITVNCGSINALYALLEMWQIVSRDSISAKDFAKKAGDKLRSLI